MDKIDWQIAFILLASVSFAVTMMFVSGFNSAVYYEEYILNCEQVEFIYEDRFSSKIQSMYLDCLKEWRTNEG